MSSYLYCRECKNGLPSPEELDTSELLNFIAFSEHGVKCKSCGKINSDYHIESVVDELAIRIDGGRKS